MPCGVYNDPLLISAQILSIVAFFFSFGGIAAFFLGLAALIILQVAWCVPLGANGLYTASALAGLASLFAFIWFIVIVVQGNDFCGSGWYSDNCDWGALAALLFLSFALWAAVAFAVAVFVSSGRLDNCQKSMDDDNNQLPSATPNNNNATTKNNVTETTVVDIQHLPGGAKKTTTTKTNADGTQTVTETIEEVQPV